MPDFITTEGEVGKVVEHSYTHVSVAVFSLHRMLKSGEDSYMYSSPFYMRDSTEQ